MRPVLVCDPLVWLLLTFWKPILVFVVVLSVLLSLSWPLIKAVAADEAQRYSAIPTTYIPETWRVSLTQAALRPTVTPP
jgi:hypothetical protein